MKNFLVIGGSRGIGQALVHLLQEAGHHVYSTDRTSYTAGGDTLPIPSDVVLDGIAYCPGSIQLVPFTRISESMFNEEMHLNTYGALKAVQLALPHLKKADQSSIVFFSTVAVQTGMPFHASVAMTKGAIEGLTRSLAAELAPKIRVNAIAPSLTETNLAEKFINTPEKIEASGKRHPLNRIGQSNDIAAMAKFLLDSESSWITGQIIHVNGGIGQLKML
jgi:NAD(P)-dependent dehydrogenase (short-subunit alcohol dehydrogenase family)